MDYNKYHEFLAKYDLKPWDTVVIKNDPRDINGLVGYIPDIAAKNQSGAKRGHVLVCFDYRHTHQPSYGVKPKHVVKLGNTLEIFIRYAMAARLLGLNTAYDPANPYVRDRACDPRTTIEAAKIIWPVWGFWMNDEVEEVIALWEQLCVAYCYQFPHPYDKTKTFDFDAHRAKLEAENFELVP